MSFHRKLVDWQFRIADFPVTVSKVVKPSGSGILTGNNQNITAFLLVGDTLGGVKTFKYKQSSLSSVRGPVGLPKYCFCNT